MFHVSLLKKAVCDYKTVDELPSGIEDENVELKEPEFILASRSIIKRGNELTSGWFLGKEKQQRRQLGSMRFLLEVNFPA